MPGVAPKNVKELALSDVCRLILDQTGTNEEFKNVLYTECVMTDVTIYC